MQNFAAGEVQKTISIQGVHHPSRLVSLDPDSSCVMGRRALACFEPLKSPRASSSQEPGGAHEPNHGTDKLEHRDCRTRKTSSGVKANITIIKLTMQKGLYTIWMIHSVGSSEMVAGSEALCR